MTGSSGRFSSVVPDDGRFQFEVLDRDPFPAPPTGRAFVPTIVAVSSKNPPRPIEFHPVPQVDVRVHLKYGELVTSNLAIQGTFRGVSVRRQFVWTSADRAIVRVPAGLAQAVIGGSTPCNRLFTWRLGEHGKVHHPPLDWLKIAFDSIKQPTDILLATIKPASLALQIVDGKGKPIGNASPRIDYADSSLRHFGAPRFAEDVEGDVSMQQFGPGTWRTYWLLPDNQFTITVGAPGFTEVKQTLKLAEGESREITS